MTIGAGFVWDPSIATHVYRDDHPLKPKRLIGVHDTLKRLGAFERPGSKVLAPRAATRAEIERIHAPEYVEAVMQASAAPDHDYSEWGLDPYRDTPPFKGMHEVSLLTTGGSLIAMEEALAGKLRVVVNFSGGLHHAMRRNASGFCIYNDPAIVCGLLADKGLKVAYVDIDAHHGDGVQAAFYDTDQVLTIAARDGRAPFRAPASPTVVAAGAGRVPSTLSSAYSAAPHMCERSTRSSRRSSSATVQTCSSHSRGSTRTSTIRSRISWSPHRRASTSCAISRRRSGHGPRWAAAATRSTRSDAHGRWSS